MKRIRGRQLQALRLALFVETVAQGKGCAVCGVAFRSMSEMVRDHIRPLAEGEVDTPDNDRCQPMCLACSNRKTHAESERGKTRAGWGGVNP